MACAKGESVAPGLIVDREGHPSQLPDDYYNGGALLPFGGHKGYGLGLMVEVLGGLLSGAGISVLPGFSGANGTLLIAIDTARFLPEELFLAQMAAFAQRISLSQPAEGYDWVCSRASPSGLPAQKGQRTASPSQIQPGMNCSNSRQAWQEEKANEAEGASRLGNGCQPWHRTGHCHRIGRQRS